MNYETKQNENKELEVKDNIEIKVLSFRIIEKIMYQISEEEQFNLKYIEQRKDMLFLLKMNQKNCDHQLILKKCCLSNQIYRQNYANHLAELIMLIGNEAQQQLTQDTNQLLNDSDEIQIIVIIKCIHNYTIFITELKQLIKYQNFDIQSNVQKQISRRDQNFLIQKQMN